MERYKKEQQNTPLYSLQMNKWIIEFSLMSIITKILYEIESMKFMSENSWFYQQW